ncbi:hypothetical protein C8R45DRAFT_1009768 [Mycena sanguinolenta]|nr:hypothetical protein C8R45DRAFT_1009768 [Mycena sanguinolenta]
MWHRMYLDTRSWESVRGNWGNWQLMRIRSFPALFLTPTARLAGVVHTCVRGDSPGLETTTRIPLAAPPCVEPSRIMPTQVQPPPQDQHQDVHNKHANVLHRDALLQALGSILAPKRPALMERSSSTSTVDSSRSSSGTASPAHGHPGLPHSPTHSQVHSPAPPPPPPHSTPMPHLHPHLHAHAPSPLAESVSVSDADSDEAQVSCPRARTYLLTAVHPGCASAYNADCSSPALEDHRLHQEQERRLGCAYSWLVLVGT